jgi:hypothetical protein
MRCIWVDEPQGPVLYHLCSSTCRLKTFPLNFAHCALRQRFWLSCCLLRKYRRFCKISICPALNRWQSCILHGFTEKFGCAIASGMIDFVHCLTVYKPVKMSDTLIRCSDEVADERLRNWGSGVRLRVRFRNVCPIQKAAEAYSRLLTSLAVRG